MTVNVRNLFVLATRQRHAALDVTALNDHRLSFKAKGLHAYIRTRPPGKLVGMPDLVEAGTNSEPSVRSGLKELMELKYLHLIQLRNKLGRISGTIHVSTPIPIAIDNDTLLEMIKQGTAHLPYVGKPHVENHDAVTGENAELAETLVGTNVPTINYNILSNSPIGLLNNNNNLYNGASAASTQNTDQIDDILTYWNNKKLLPNHRRGEQYKTYRDIVKHTGKALRKHSAMVIKDAIDNYEWMLGRPYIRVYATNAPYKVGLNEFFKFNKYNESLINEPKHLLRGMDNWFAECKKGREHLYETYGALSKDRNPAVTKALIGAVLASPNYVYTNEKQFTRVDLNTFIKASALIVEFINTYKQRLPKRTTPSSIITRLLAFVGTPRHVGYLASEFTWNGFDKYLEEAGVLEPARRGVQHGAKKATG